MSVALHFSGDESGFDLPRKLFQKRAAQKFWNILDVTPDGLRFVMNLPFERSNSSLSTVMTNWTGKPKKPTK